MSTIRVALNVPGVTEAEVPADARVVGVEDHHCDGCAARGEVWDYILGEFLTCSECLGKRRPHLVLDVPESPQVRLERRRFHVLSNPPEGSGWLLAETVPYRHGYYGVWQERLFDVPTAVPTDQP